MATATLIRRKNCLRAHVSVGYTLVGLAIFRVVMDIDIGITN